MSLAQLRDNDLDRLQTLEQNHAQMLGQVMAFGAKVEALDEKMDDGFSRMEAGLSRIEASIARVDTRVQDHGSRLQTIEGSRASWAKAGRWGAGVAAALVTAVLGVALGLR